MTDLLKCRRCRWVGIHEELRQRPQPEAPYILDNVCPRCGCKTFTKKEPSND